MCRVATNMEGDTFVGIKAEIIEGVQEVTVNFPLGFEIAKDAETARRDLFYQVFRDVLSGNLNKSNYYLIVS